MIYIRRDGAIINFCSRKCRINQTKLKRVPRKVKWTREYQNLKAIRKASEIHNAEKAEEQEKAEKQLSTQEGSEQ